MAKLKFKDPNGDWIELGGAGGIIDTTYSNLYSLWNMGTLEPTATYRITDYASTHIIPNTSELYTPDVEPLIVTALDNASLSPIAYSINYPQDIIYYSIESDQAKVNGCQYGYISRRIDTYQHNDIPFDFRNVVFRRWKIDVTNVWDINEMYGPGQVVLYANDIYRCIKPTYDYVNNIYLNQDMKDYSYWYAVSWPNYSYISPSSGWDFMPVNQNDYIDTGMWQESQYYSSAFDNFISESDDSTDLLSQQNNVIYGYGFSNNHILSSFKNNSIDQYFRSNIVYNNCTDNLFGPYFESNVLNDNFATNIVGQSFYENTTGSNCVQNFFGDNVYNNAIASDMQNNTIYSNFQGNKLDWEFTYNKIGNDCNRVSIGPQFNNNIVGDNFTDNILGSRWDGNEIGDYFQFNTIGSFSYDNKIKNQFQYNAIVGQFRDNVIDDQFQYNRIGNQFQSNHVSSSMRYNSVGDYCINSTMGGNFYNNVVENYVWLNVGESCTDNHFETHAHVTTVDNFTDNVVKSGATVDATYWYYVYDFGSFAKNRTIFMNGNDQVQLQYTDKYSNTVILNDTEAKINPIPVT